jgi:hypothetical protein
VLWDDLGVEGFEHVVAIAMEADDLVVSGPLKFLVEFKTKKKKYDEYQTHGYEVDLVGVRQDRLVLASVKSFFGSAGVKAHQVTGESDGSGYRMLNDVALRS